MNDLRPVSFPAWKTILVQAGLEASVQAAHAREILTFLHHCKQTRSAATVRLIRQWLAGPRLRLRRPGLAPGVEQAREALRWFYRNAPKVDPGGPAEGREGPGIGAEGRGLRSTRPATEDAAGGESVLESSRSTSESVPGDARRFLRPMEPRPAAQDLGGPDWERRLIQTLRLRGLLWRTEDTYRMWSRRFAEFIAPKSPYAAAGEEVAAFLTDLAVRNRSSPSAQRQALNALVFLMEEALGRALGEMDFQRACPRERVPAVLTPEECRRIFTRLEGTTRLMAELMYGSGLRLMELLRLRVQHLDLERMQLTVRGGKGDRVNGSADAVVT